MFYIYACLLFILVMTTNILLKVSYIVYNEFKFSTTSEMIFLNAFIILLALLQTVSIGFQLKMYMEFEDNIHNELGEIKIY